MKRRIYKIFVLFLCSIFIFISVSSFSTRRTSASGLAPVVLGVGGSIALIGWLYSTFCGTESSQFTINSIGQTIYDVLDESVQNDIQRIKVSASGSILVPATVFNAIKYGISDVLLSLQHSNGALGGDSIFTTYGNEYLVGSPRYGLTSASRQTYYSFEGGVCFCSVNGYRYNWHFVSYEPFTLIENYEKSNGTWGSLSYTPTYDTKTKVYSYSITNTTNPLGAVYPEIVSINDFINSLSISINNDGVVGWDNEEDEQTALDGFNDIPNVNEDGSVTVLNPEVTSAREMADWLENVGAMEYATDIPNVYVHDNDDVANVPDNPIEVPDDWHFSDYVIGGLSEFFPFCIPFDLYYIITIFNAEPEPIIFDYVISFGGEFDDYTVHIDLSKFSSVASVFRVMMFLFFLVFITLKIRDLIRG